MMLRIGLAILAVALGLAAPAQAQSYPSGNVTVVVSLAAGTTDLVAGHVVASFNEAGLSIPLVKEGKLQALAVTASQRLPLLPDTPSFAEAAGVPDYEGVSWHMLLAPAKTPRAIAERLHDKIASIGLIPSPPMSIEETQAYIKSERVKWGGLVKQLGLEGSQ